VFEANFVSAFHRLLWINDNVCSSDHLLGFEEHKWKLEYISTPFYFDHKGIEFCKSISYSYDEKVLLMGIGIEDREAWIYFVSTDTIDKMLLKAMSYY